MSDTARDLLKNTAGLVNIRLGAADRPLMTDTEILGFVQLAYRDVKVKLAEKGHSNLRIEVDVTAIPAGATSLTLTSTPALPSWVLEPIKLWERQNGGSVWIPMTKTRDHLPMNPIVTSGFGYWEFRDQAIHFLEANVNMDVRIHAYTRLSDLTMPLDTVGIPDLVNAVSYAAAALALGGDPFLEQKGRDALQSIANLDAHMKLATGSRRRRIRRGLRIWRS